MASGRHPMTKGQRWVVLLVLWVCALALHFSYFFWVQNTVHNFVPLLTVGHARAPNASARAETGILYRYGPSTGATVLGVVLPIVLIGTSLWLWLGWRRTDALVSGSHGACAACGHPLAAPGRCPECGTGG